ncbi:MAG: hypothetical protein MJ247_01605 [Alphaproteobacteria bacterium]|nr:hypothetical protein [Alphaproteobacteria bacterium]
MPIIDEAFNAINQPIIPWEEPKIPFKIADGDEQHRCRIAKLVNDAYENSPIAREILESAHKGGFSIAMESTPGICGYTSNEDKLICLNSAMSDHENFSTLIHEARHAQQLQVFPECDKFGSFDIKSEIMIERATEADAQAISLAACAEVYNKTGDNSYIIGFKDHDPIISGAFFAAGEKGSKEVSDKQIQAAFNAWYKETEIVQSYEEGYLSSRMHYSMSTKDYEKYPYSEHLESENIVQAICKNGKGECYWADDLTILTDREKTFVHEDTIKDIKKYMKAREKDTGIEPNEDYKDLKVYDAYKSYSESFNDLKHVFSKDYMSNWGRDKHEPIGFEKETTPFEGKRLNHVINELCQDEETKKSLQAMKDAGYKLTFEPLQKPGSCIDPRRKYVIFANSCNDEQLTNEFVKQANEVKKQENIKSALLLKGAKQR